MAAAIQCDACKTPLPEAMFNAGDGMTCPGCGERTRVEVFPALFRPAAQGRAGENILIEGEASCFYHPQKRAAVPCASCGRFLCALCDCELQGQHYCPGCLETGDKKGRIPNLQSRRTRHDHVALLLVGVPLVIFPLFYFTVITAPMAIYVVIRHWKSPRSLVQPGSARFVFALGLAILELAGWGVLVYMMANE